MSRFISGDDDWKESVCFIQQHYQDAANTIPSTSWRTCIRNGVFGRCLKFKNGGWWASCCVYECSNSYKKKTTGVGFLGFPLKNLKRLVDRNQWTLLDLQKMDKAVCRIEQTRRKYALLIFNQVSRIFLFWNSQLLIKFLEYINLCSHLDLRDWSYKKKRNFWVVALLLILYQALGNVM